MPLEESAKVTRFSPMTHIGHIIPRVEEESHINEKELELLRFHRVMDPDCKLVKAPGGQINYTNDHCNVIDPKVIKEIIQQKKNGIDRSL